MVAKAMISTWHGTDAVRAHVGRIGRVLGGVQAPSRGTQADTIFADAVPAAVLASLQQTRAAQSAAVVAFPEAVALALAEGGVADSVP